MISYASSDRLIRSAWKKEIRSLNLSVSALLVSLIRENVTSSLDAT